MHSVFTRIELLKPRCFPNVIRISVSRQHHQKRTPRQEGGMRSPLGNQRYMQTVS